MWTNWKIKPWKGVVMDMSSCHQYSTTKPMFGLGRVWMFGVGSICNWMKKMAIVIALL
jgi:hypothetical protein